MYVCIYVVHAAFNALALAMFMLHQVLSLSAYLMSYQYFHWSGATHHQSHLLAGKGHVEPEISIRQKTITTHSLVDHIPVSSNMY